MARITPPTQGSIPQLEDHEPYRASIANIEWDQSEHPQYGQQTRLVVDFALDNQPDQKIRDWIALRLGRQQNGQVSKLRKLLNAIGQQPEAADIAWFDDDTLEWSYDGNKPYAKLDLGLPVIIRGQTVEKPSENGPKRRFVINVYQPAGIAQKSEPRRLGRPQVVKPTPSDIEDDEVPF